MPIGPEDDGGAVAWLRDVVRQVQLGWKLFWDRRVPFWTKMIPPLALAYLISPVDLSFWVPIVGLNALDDIAVLLLGLKLFVELSPPEVVREHLRSLGVRISEWRVARDGDAPTVIDGEFRLQDKPQEPAEEEEE
jgi:uncharacterized membrane protein YkvA (DUF1232 family)